MNNPSAEARVPLYPRSVKGSFRRFKNSILVIAYLVYYGLPWLPWSRSVGPDRAVLFDIIGRKFYFFGLVVQPQQMFWLAGLLMIAALLLFFVTGVAGRVFCGYFCFQTLWSDLFFKIEHWIQGERPARIRLARQSWNGEKFRKIGFTWLLWFAVAFWTAITFTLYWGEAGDLLRRFFTGEAPSAMYITVAVLTFTTFTMAGLAREQVCTHMCPYSRFQAAMFDKDTKLVAYDANRGEGIKGRAKMRKGQKTLDERHGQGSGDCIDCGYCVQVCPTGIDIRDGLQISCIHCGLCIDACNNIMDSLDWPHGLIRYSSETEAEGGKVRIFKLKSIGYALAIVIVTAVLGWSISHKADLETAITQTRQPLFVTLSDGSILNSYEIKLANQTTTEKQYSIAIRGLDDAELDTGKFSQLTLQPLKNLRLMVKVKRSPGDHRLNKVDDFEFVIKDDASNQEAAVIPARFYAP
jgi:cytochrome c oxidase accessory protein FixG